MRAGLRERDQAQLRKRAHALATARSRPTERLLVLRRVGDIQARPIQAHQPQPAIERAPGRLARQRACGRPEQKLKRLPALRCF